MIFHEENPRQGADFLSLSTDLLVGQISFLSHVGLLPQGGEGKSLNKWLESTRVWRQLKASHSQPVVF